MMSVVVGLLIVGVMGGLLIVGVIVGLLIVGVVAEVFGVVEGASGASVTVSGLSTGGFGGFFFGAGLEILMRIAVFHASAALIAELRWGRVERLVLGAGVSGMWTVGPVSTRGVLVSTLSSQMRWASSVCSRM